MSHLALSQFASLSLVMGASPVPGDRAVVNRARLRRSRPSGFHPWREESERQRDPSATSCSLELSASPNGSRSSVTQSLS